MTARIAPVYPPFPAEIQERFDRVMPKGVPPLTLFTTLARDERLFARFFGGSLLGPGHLKLRQREIVIDRITALSGSEYEWGVHVTFFGKAAELTEAQIYSLTKSGADEPVWTDAERALLHACDQLHTSCDLDEEAWQALRTHFSEEAILEILMLAGFYRMVSYLTNGLRLPLESYAARFPADR
jgi:alkylhydroperoxidase family enzyme